MISEVLTADFVVIASRQMRRCCTSKKPCLACGMPVERRLWTARTLASPHTQVPATVYNFVFAWPRRPTRTSISTLSARFWPGSGDSRPRTILTEEEGPGGWRPHGGGRGSRRHRSQRQRRTGPGSLGRGGHGLGSATRLYSRLACVMCIKNTVQKFLECSAIGCSSCSMRSGAVGAVQRSHGSKRWYVSVRSWYIPWYKVVYTCIYTMKRKVVYTSVYAMVYSQLYTMVYTLVWKLVYTMPP